MNRNVLLIVRAVCAIAVGVLLMASPELYTTLMVQIIGGIFLVSGIVPLAGFWFPSSAGRMRPVFPVVGVGSILLGMLLLLIPDVFVRALMYVLAIFFLVGGLQQLMSQMSARKYVPMRWWTVLMSLMLVALGVFVLANPMKTASVPFLLLGIGCVYYGVTELARAILRIVYERRNDHHDEYVDYEEVTDDDTMRR
ncbi:MAG: HdeD family acid-resistance protein [Bacteroidaceae bacterium]